MKYVSLFVLGLKHLRSYGDGAIVVVIFDQCGATQECQATDTTPHPVTVY